MRIIDDRGYLFGLVNIIDALVVLVLAAVLIAGFALVTGSGSPATTDTDTDTAVIVFQTDAYPDFVIGAIEEGENENEDVVSVLDKSVTDLPDNQSQTGVNMTRARLQVEVVVGTSSDGLATFNGERLYVGREMELDFRTTIVEGMVVEFES